MTVPAYILAVLLAYYVFFVLRVFVGLRRLRSQERTSSCPTVTVIIAARNEERNISTCVRSVLAQDYPRDALKVIVVDDASTDATTEIVRSIGRTEPRVSVVTLAERPNDGISGKPDAIRAGVEHAEGEIVITTDADCLHPRGWVRTMVSQFLPETALVAGPVVLVPGRSLFSKVERLDFLGLVISGAGLIGAGRPIICNGANLAYRREVYLRALSGVQHSSNDDGTLMSRIVTRRLGRVAFASAPDALVTTQGQGDLGSFFRQRRRWAAVRGRFLDPTIYLELTLLYAFFVLFLFMTFAAIVDRTQLPTVVFAWCVKIGVDLAPLLSATRAWNIEHRWLEVILAEVFHPFSIVIATALSLVAPFRWKERTLVR
jgi:cellulose synthase/poly-beta-1,6-N-acetylglucosamine synthase-like glycosyltransferase